MKAKEFFIGNFCGKNNWKNRVISLVLVIMMGVSVYVFTREDPKKFMHDTSYTIISDFKEVSRDFPSGLCGYVKWLCWEEREVPSAEWDRYIDKKSLRQQVKALIARSYDLDYGGAGGVVFVKDDSGKKYLDFSVVPGIGERILKEIEAHRDDDKYLMGLIERERPSFVSSCLDNETIFSNFYNNAKENKEIEPGKSKDFYTNLIINNSLHIPRFDSENYNFYLNLLMAQYLEIAGQSYELEIPKDIMKKVYYPGALTDNFLGMFHINGHNETPSWSNLEDSKRMRKFIVSTRDNGFMLYILEGGKITKEIFVEDEKKKLEPSPAGEDRKHPLFQKDEEKSYPAYGGGGLA